MTTSTATTTTTKAAKKNTNSAKNGKSQHAPAHAPARGPFAKPKIREIIELRLEEVIIEAAWNSRDTEHVQGTGKLNLVPTLTPDNDLSDQELRDSIAQYGILQACGVREVSGHYHLVWGFRRFSAAMEVLGPKYLTDFVLKTRNKDAVLDDYEARILNLTENLQRKNLQPFEIARTLHLMMKGNPGLTVKQLSEDVGLSYSYTSNLVRISKRACAQLWDIFCTYGTSFGSGITYKDFVSIVALPKDKQMKAWHKLVDERTGKGARASGAKGSKKAPSAMTLEGFLMNVSKIEGPPAFRDGFSYGLQVALGDMQMSLKGYEKQKKKKAAAAKKVAATKKKAAKKKAPGKRAKKTTKRARK